jgi:hypothetical protein
VCECVCVCVCECSREKAKDRGSGGLSRGIDTALMAFERALRASKRSVRGMCVGVAMRSKLELMFVHHRLTILNKQCVRARQGNMRWNCHGELATAHVHASPSHNFEQAMRACTSRKYALELPWGACYGPCSCISISLGSKAPGTLTDWQKAQAYNVVSCVI